MEPTSSRRISLRRMVLSTVLIQSSCLRPGNCWQRRPNHRLLLSISADRKALKAGPFLWRALPSREREFRSRSDGEIDKASLLRRAINALAGLGIVLGLRIKDALHKLLRIAIVERKPARLDLHHYPMSRQENMIRMRQFERIFQYFVGRNRGRMTGIVAVAPAQHIHGN